MDLSSFILVYTTLLAFVFKTRRVMSLQKEVAMVTSLLRAIEVLENDMCWYAVPNSGYTLRQKGRGGQRYCQIT